MLNLQINSLDQMIKFVFCLLIISALSTPQEYLSDRLRALKDARQLKGMQVQISIEGDVRFNANLGQKNEKQENIDNSTVYRIASVSKSFSSVAIMQLMQQGKLQLNQSLSSIFGYAVINPYFPEEEMTIQMILSHQSSLIECEPFYSNFLEASDIDQVSDVPDLKEILVKGGKFYNECFYSQSRRPGQYFDYVNLNFIIAATIVEILSGQRFDVYQRENVLKHISIGLEEMATFDVTSIKNANNLGVIYTGEDSQWVPSFDYHPDGKIPPKNFTGYRIGSNGAVFAPQGSMRASVSHLTNYAIMLANLGVTKEGVKIISESSVKEMVKPKYHYHGSKGGAVRDFHQYGFGLYTTTYRVADSIISHQVVRGHYGDAYGLLSALYFWKNYTLTYIISGALEGYTFDKDAIYEQERILLHKAVEQYIEQKRQLQLKLQ